MTSGNHYAMIVNVTRTAERTVTRVDRLETDLDRIRKIDTRDKDRVLERLDALEKENATMRQNIEQLKQRLSYFDERCRTGRCAKEAR